HQPEVVRRNLNLLQIQGSYGVVLYGNLVLFTRAVVCYRQRILAIHSSSASSRCLIFDLFSLAGPKDAKEFLCGDVLVSTQPCSSSRRGSHQYLEGFRISKGARSCAP